MQLIWTIDRALTDPAHFPNTEKFDPSGSPPLVRVCPLVGGPQICVGNEFARMEMMVFSHHIVLHFEWKMVDPDEPIN